MWSLPKKCLVVLALVTLAQAGSLIAKQANDTSKIGIANFTQLIDHNNPSLGTFEQRYAYCYEYWKGPGSPVVFGTRGEANLTLASSLDPSSFVQKYFALNQTISVLAQALGAAVVLIEHRYWGESIPFQAYTNQSLLYLTVENAIADFTNFAMNVKLPFDPNCTSQADLAPWVFVGGSYAGALAAWTASTSPGTFWAYWASSAVVQAIDEFWEYQVPIEAAMPQNCSKDIQLVSNHIDEVFFDGSDDQIADLKGQFGNASQGNDDFLQMYVGQIETWQYVQFVRDLGSFYKFCDYVENISNTSSSIPGPEGVGLSAALAGYAEGIHAIPNTQLKAMSTSGTPWEWLLCNEPLHWWITGAPDGQVSLYPRAVNVSYYLRTGCEEAFGSDYNPANRSVEEFNAWTGGWDIAGLKRVLFVNGPSDPWREATVSSDFRPGGPLISSNSTPVFIVPNGTHGSDQYYVNATVNAGAKAVIDEAIITIQNWVSEWPDIAT